ncbi:MAG: HAD hydrolase-like protein [Burkholderiales bacterium]
MSLVHAIRRGLRNLVSRTTFERELDDELRDYLERATAEHLRAGASLPEAARAARREIGSLEAAKEEVRSGLWEASVQACWRDVVYGARMLARRPGVTTVVVLTLALGIGANSAIFSLVDAVLLRTLPVGRPEQLVLIEQGMARGGTQNMSRPLFERLRDEGLAIGLLSNTVWPAAWHDEILDRDGVLHLLDGRVYTSEIDWTKPHEEAFAAARAAIGVHDPTACVYVGDRLFDDIWGAHNAGMRAIWVPHSDIPPEQLGHSEGKPDAIVQSLSDIPGLLSQINSPS